jgi:hypothetical protein
MTASFAALIRHLGVDVAGEPDGRERRMPVLRHIPRDRRRLDESRIDRLPVGIDPHTFLDQAAEVEVANDPFEHIEAVEGGGEVDRRRVLR